jgi:hypothetical protein
LQVSSAGTTRFEMCTCQQLLAFAILYVILACSLALTEAQELTSRFFHPSLYHPRQAGELTKEQEAKLPKIEDFVFDAKKAQIVRDEYLAGRLPQLTRTAPCRLSTVMTKTGRAIVASEATAAAAPAGSGRRDHLRHVDGRYRGPVQGAQGAGAQASSRAQAQAALVDLGPPRWQR